MERRRKVIDSNIPCDSKTRGRHANNLHRSPRHPVFTIVFRNLNGSDISVVRDELSTRDKFYILPPLLLPASFPIRLHIPLRTDRPDSNRLIRPIVPTTEFTKFRYGADSNYLSDWNIQNADNPPPPVLSRCFNEPWILDDDLGRGRFDRILNEGSRDLSSFLKKDNWPSCLRGCKGYGRGFEKFIVNNGGWIYIFWIRLEYSGIISFKFVIIYFIWISILSSLYFL